MPQYIIALLIAINILPFSAGVKENLENKLTAKYELVKSENTKKELPKVLTAPTKTTVGDFNDGKAVFSYDLDSDTVISAHNEDTRLQIASLTKLMTAYIILKENSLESVVTVPNYQTQGGDAVMGITPGENLKSKNILKGLLINSGSDAAETLAITNGGSEKAFVAKMNDYATKLKLSNTHFTNPVGWDDQNNYSSAKDLSVLARILLRNKTFAEIVQTKNETVYTEAGRAIALTNTNILLGENGVIGIKTGFTYAAGECLITLDAKDNKHVLTVIIGSYDRFGQTRAYLDWIFTHFSW